MALAPDDISALHASLEQDRRERRMVRRGLGVLGVLALLFAAFVARARPAGELALFFALNGEPTKLGVLTSSGASVNNSTTAVTFTLPSRTIGGTAFYGTVLKVVCDAKAYITPGATASGTATAATYGHPTLAETPYYLILQDTTSQLAAISASGTANCAVFQML